MKNDLDDVFSESRMPFAEHIEELRTHLLRAIQGLLVAVVIGFVLSPFIVDAMTEPAKRELQAFHQRRIQKVKDKYLGNPETAQAGEFVEKKQVNLKELAALLGLPEPREEWGDLSTKGNRYEDVLNQEVTRLEILHSFMTTMSATEAAIIYIKVAFVAGFVLGSPWTFYQIWLFIAAGLYAHEKRLVQVYMPFSLGLFLGGVALCQFYVMPRALGSLLWFNELIGINPDLRLSEWMGFALFLPLVFGFSFQTPVAMLFLFQIGVFGLDELRRHRRLAWFLLACFAAFLTPTPDPVNMLFMWVPLVLLFEVGIWLCRLNTRPPRREQIVEEEQEELVEV